MIHVVLDYFEASHSVLHDMAKRSHLINEQEFREHGWHIAKTAVGLALTCLTR